MIIIDSSYTIKYSKGGIAQFADFNYSKGKLVSNSFRPIWVKNNEIPSLGVFEKEEEAAIAYLNSLQSERMYSETIEFAEWIRISF